MASDISELLKALKKWQKAIRQLKKKGKSPQQRQRQLERSEQEVMRYLTADTVQTEINDLIEAAIASDSPSAEELRAMLIRDTHPLIAIEIQTIKPLCLRPEDLEPIIAAFLQQSTQERPITKAEELSTLFSKLHLLIVREYKVIPTLSRKAKKRRKPDLTLGTLHTTVGLGLLAGNTLLDNETAKYSYILGGNALLMALRNFVGQPSDNSAAEG
jgi:ribosome-binding protein aMBF1 (putative translation factor)